MTDLTRANGHGPDQGDDWLMGDDAPPARPKGPYSRGVKTYADLGWTGMIPISSKTKVAAREGLHGREGKQTRPETYSGTKAIKVYGKCDLGWRVPLGIVGLDVDQYDGKTGADSLAELEARLGALPKTWTSTSRGMDSISRIHFFKIPEDAGELKPFAGRDIDVIQHHHRYAVVWPSVHAKTEAEYRWYRPSGELHSTAPQPDAFAVLPDAWLEHLKKSARDEVPGAGAGVQDFLAEATGNDEPEIIGFILDAFNDQPGGRHDSMLIALGWAARAAADWKIPATEVFDFLEEAWETATDGEDRDREFRDLLERAVSDAPVVRNPENAGAVAALMSKLMDREALRSISPPAHLIKGWLTAGMGHRINGDPGSGKSLVVLDWAASIGCGVPWMGCDTTRGTVLYVVAEGVEGFASKRVPAWEAHHGQDMEGVLVYPEPIQVVERRGGELRASTEWKTFLKVVKQVRPDLVIFDTQRRVMRDAEENSNTDLGKGIDCLEDMRRDTGSAYLLVHHTPKNGAGGVGGGAIWGAVNTEFGMTKKGRGLEASRYRLENTKEKDGEDGAQLEFRLRQYDVTPEDSDTDPFMDDPVTSVVLVPVVEDEEPPAIQEVDLSLVPGTRARDAVSILIRRVWRDRAFTRAQAWSTVKDAGVMERQTFYRNFGRLQNENVINAERGAAGQELQRFTIIDEGIDQGSGDDFDS
jgi:AAA domain-containing protein/bifunctional DNA primase/polymerase-like protein